MLAQSRVFVFKSITTVTQNTAKNVSRSAPQALYNRMNSSEAGVSSTSNLKVEHDKEGLEFYIKLTDSKEEDSKAFLQYSYINPDYVDLEHTVVPSQFRGHGIAKVLAQTAFDHFVEKGALIRPTCTYLQKFYNENPKPKYIEKVKWD